MTVQIADMLREHGAHPTAQRIALAQILFARPQHLSAEDLLEQARVQGFKVSMVPGSSTNFQVGARRPRNAWATQRVAQ